MPNIEIGDYTQDTSGEAYKQDYGYDYPYNLNLKPGSEESKKIVDFVMQRARISSAHMSRYHDKWNKLDRSLTAYVDLDDKEKEVQAADNRKPVSIVVPHSYAILEATLGYMVSAFFQEPIFRFEGTSPDDTIGGILLTKVIDLHCFKTAVALNLHTMFRDNFVYSFGAVAPGWEVRRGSKAVKKARYSPLSRLFGQGEPIGYDREVVENAKLFEGNKLTNIDPYTALPDPNYPIYEVKKSEFFGWVERSNLYSMLSEEKNAEEGEIFNVKYLRGLQNRTSFLSKDKSSREDKVKGTSGSRDQTYTKPVDRINMYLKIIPKDFKLSKSEYPEVWYISVAADEVITEIRPVGTYEGEIPIEACSSEYDGYSVSPISRLELLYGMQHTMDWMFSSHIHNVRKALNDVLIVDPFLVNVPDLQDPGPGGIVRMRRPAWGRGTKDAVSQLNIHDVTQNNVRDVMVMMEFMDKTSSVSSAAQGALRKTGPERLTGQEFQGSRQAGLNRLEKVARIISLQAMMGIANQFANHTQQLMDEQVYIDVFGKWQDVLMKEFGITDPDSQKIKVDPLDLLVDYEIKARDGSIPGGNYSPVWEKMFELMAKEPNLQQNFDIVRVFKHIARNNGAKNVEEFVKIKVAPDQVVQDQAQAGNIISLDQAGIPQL